MLRGSHAVALKHRKIIGTKGDRVLLPIMGGAPTVAELEDRRGAVSTEANEILKEAGGDPSSLAPEKLEKLRTLDTEYQQIEKDIGTTAAAAEEFKNTADRFRVAEEEAGKLRDKARAPLYAGDEGEGEILTPGETFVRSDVYKAWMSKFPTGGPPVEISAWSGGEDVGQLRGMLGMPSATEKLRGTLTAGKFRDLV